MVVAGVSSISSSSANRSEWMTHHDLPSTSYHLTLHCFVEFVKRLAYSFIENDNTLMKFKYYIVNMIDEAIVNQRSHWMLFES